MRFFPKLWKWVTGIAIVGIVFVLLAPILASRLVNHNAIKKELTQRVAAQIGAELSFLDVDIALLPRPHLTIRQPQLSRGNEFMVQAEAARFYPRLLPLIKGKIEPARIGLESAEYTLRLPAVTIAPEQPPPAGQLDHVHQMTDRIRRLLRQMSPLDLPDVELHIRNGRVRLLERTAGRPGFELRHIQGYYQRRHRKIDFTFECMSNVFKQVAINGWLDPDTMSGVAHIDLADFQPEGVVDYLYPGSAFQISQAQVSATVDIDVEGGDRIRVRLMGSVPRMNVKHKGSVMAFRDQQLHGELILEDQRLVIHLTDVTSAAPRMNLTGEFGIDEKIAGVNLNLKGAAVDVAGVRAAALTLMGQNETVVEIFDVLKGGQVPQITVTAGGRRLSDLGSIENYTIKGQMLAGKIFIPDVGFDLRTVSGDAAITGGVLRGERLKAELGNSSGTDGSLTLDLGASDLFELDIDVQADLTQLPPVLRRLIDDKAVVAELNRISDVTGQAAGRLYVSQKAGATGVTVNAGEMNLTARYDRIPYAVNISQGKLKLHDDRITVSDLMATAGNTKLSGISGHIDWQKALLLNLEAAALQFDAAELRAWLTQPAIADLSGAFEIKDLSVKYKMPAAASGDFDIGGGSVRADLAAPRLPAALSIDGGRFRYYRDHLALSGVTARLGKSAVNQLDATVAWGNAGTVRASAARAELVLGELFPWFAKLANHQGAFADLSAVSGTIWLTDPTISGPLENPAAWQWDTTASLHQLQLRSKTLGAPIAVASAEFTAASAAIGRSPGTRIALKPVEIGWGPSRLAVAGGAGLSRDGLQLDLQIAADRLQWPQIEHIVARTDRSTASGDSTAIQGVIAVRADRFQYDDLTWRPVDVTLSLAPGQVNLDVARAGLCNIDFSGHINFSGERIDLHLVPVAKNKSLNPTITCLTKDKDMATGQFDFNGKLDAQARTADLRKSIGGDLSLAATGGRIYRFGVLAKIFAILNVTEIYRGQLPELAGEGFAYDTMTIVADVKKSTVIMRQCAVEAPSMGLACEGDIDLAKGEMDIVILVAPFRTVDRIVKHIPIVGGIMGGKLISIPFRAKGALGNPTVIPLSPTAVGSGVLGILERTLRLPIDLMQPLFSKPKVEKKSPENHD